MQTTYTHTQFKKYIYNMLTTDQPIKIIKKPVADLVRYECHSAQDKLNLQIACNLIDLSN